MDKAKLTFIACDKDKKPKANKRPFSVMLNPESVSVDYGISYASDKENENSKKSVGESAKIKIPKLVFDTTGVIPKEEWPSVGWCVWDMVGGLKEAVYDFDGKDHDTPSVKIQWGPSIFWSRMTSMSVQYTLFESDGTPVRAIVSLDFDCYESQKESVAKKNKQSPDLTHLVEVRAGDSLPLMCERIYNDPSLYLQVAKFNGLTNFRHLKPGSRLVFPPIVD